MIRGTGRHPSSLWLSRVSSRRGYLLSPAQFMALVLTQTMTPTILKMPFQTAILRSCPARRDGYGPTIRFGTKRPA
jgi:hypothetical protein